VPVQRSSVTLAALLGSKAAVRVMMTFDLLPQDEELPILHYCIGEYINKSDSLQVYFCLSDGGLKEWFNGLP